ncbi:unnamed protein product [Effrenium voratum]|uniref:Uncharacterized protein n=1 Tax=Effrenium voratum TaxID=2562239 RepID=A0AA36IKN0_9DINO|nr:unnamed protein product [Effrenium voratum]CAJ1422865.1 unnamed protein product [Effrenium voratum]
MQLALPSHVSGLPSAVPARHVHTANPRGWKLPPTPAMAAVLAGAVTVTRRLPKVRATEKTQTMERPLLDNLITSGVKALEAAELQRVKSASETPSEGNGNWSGEPREWANSDSVTQQISRLSQMGPLAQAKQFIADKLAGDYDEERIGQLIDDKINSNKIMMFSFSTCPFCLRAKQILEEDYGEQIEVYECDLEPDGYAVRAELGRRTGRTSMPSTWLGPTQLGGCNDGGIGGVATLDQEGRLGALLAERRMGSPLEWLAALGRPDQQETVNRKKALVAACEEAPKNGVGADEDTRAKVEAAAFALEASCPSQPAQMTLNGVWDLVYSTAEGSSNGKIGPLVGDVTQTFVDDTRFVNAVEFGPLRVALEAERKILDDRQIRVSFKETVFSLFGLEMFRKPTKGSGVWTQRFVDAGLRVMDTPSLFVLRKRRA